VVPWVHLVPLEKEVQLEEEDLKDHLVCQVCLEVLVGQAGRDLQVKPELLVSLEEMENREENIARMIYEKFARLF